MLFICLLHKHINSMTTRALFVLLTALFTSFLYLYLTSNKCPLNINDCWIIAKSKDWESGHFYFFSKVEQKVSIMEIAKKRIHVTTASKLVGGEETAASTSWEQDKGNYDQVLDVGHRFRGQRDTGGGWNRAWEQGSYASSVSAPNMTLAEEVLCEDYWTALSRQPSRLVIYRDFVYNLVPWITNIPTQ